MRFIAVGHRAHHMPDLTTRAISPMLFSRQAGYAMWHAGAQCQASYAMWHAGAQCQASIRRRAGHAGVHAARRAGRAQTSRALHLPPDNAPTQRENEDWLGLLAAAAADADAAAADADAAATDAAAADEPFASGSVSVMPANFVSAAKKNRRDPRSEVKTLDDLKYRVTGHANGYHDCSIVLKDYFMGSEYLLSLFSRFSNRVSQARRIEQKTFVDLKIVSIASGKGGNGCVSFLRDANRAVGPPDGGDGGDGGDVYVRVLEGITSLHKVRKSYRAGDGAGGAGSQLDGRRGDDIIVDVPVGTTVRWIPDPHDIRRVLKQTHGDAMRAEFHIKAPGDTVSHVQLFRPELYGVGDGWVFKDKDAHYHLERAYFNDLNKTVGVYDQEVIAEELASDTFPLLGIDFDEPTAKPRLLMKGGKGGMGNMHFLTKDIRNPRFAKRGRLGLSGSFLFELKLLADLGLVGLPNAGKLTLLRAILRARPRVGHWEFTTLQPTVGTISTGIDRDPFTVADIPGIVRGARQNKGMGLDFLRHIERLAGLVFVVSLELASPVADLEVLMAELTAKTLEGKRVLVVATKADLSLTPNLYNQLRDFARQRDWRILPVCAAKGENIEACIEMMSKTAYNES
jgi:GTP-binding protein